MGNERGGQWNGSAVNIHGPALRHIRMLTGLNTKQFANEVGVTADYVRKVENGVRPQVGPATFNRMLAVLRIDDRRVLLADPGAGPGLADHVTTALIARETGQPISKRYDYDGLPQSAKATA